MSGAHRKPSPEGHTFLVRPADAGSVRAAISGVVAKAINEAAGTVRKIREWCDIAASGNAYCQHEEAPRECESCDLVALLVEEVRALLPPVPEAAEEVEQVDGTRVTRGDDREY